MVAGVVRYLEPNLINPGPIRPQPAPRSPGRLTFSTSARSSTIHSSSAVFDPQEDRTEPIAHPEIDLSRSEVRVFHRVDELAAGA